MKKALGNRFNQLAIVISLLVLAYFILGLHAVIWPVSWEKNWYVTERQCTYDLLKLKRELEWDFMNSGRIPHMAQLLQETEINESTRKMYYLELSDCKNDVDTLKQFTIYAWPIGNLKYQGPDSLDLSAYALTAQGNLLIRAPDREGKMVWKWCTRGMPISFDWVPDLIEKKIGLD